MPDQHEKPTVVIHCGDVDDAQSRRCRRQFTIAGILENGKLKIGIAVMNPKDRQYNKRIGASKALGRARSEHPICSERFVYGDIKIPAEIFKHLHQTVSFYAKSLASMDERQFVHAIGKLYSPKMQYCDGNIHHTRWLNDARKFVII